MTFPASSRLRKGFLFRLFEPMPPPPPSPSSLFHLPSFSDPEESFLRPSVKCSDKPAPRNDQRETSRRKAVRKSTETRRRVRCRGILASEKLHLLLPAEADRRIVEFNYRTTRLGLDPGSRLFRATFAVEPRSELLQIVEYVSQRSPPVARRR